MYIIYDELKRGVLLCAIIRVNMVFKLFTYYMYSTPLSKLTKQVYFKRNDSC